MYDVEYHISTVFIYHCEAKDEADARKQFKANNSLPSRRIRTGAYPFLESLDSPITHADIKVTRIGKCDEVPQEGSRLLE
jgi:hypothetical protein